MLIYYLLILILVLFDQFSKFWVVSNLDLHVTYPMIDSVLSLFYLHNDGAAWGILSGQMWLFYLITVAVLVVLVYLLHHDGRQHPLAALSFALIIAGAIGNFIDRLRLGYVVDMFKLEFIDFPIFNLADTFLTIGVILLIIYTLFIAEDKQ